MTDDARRGLLALALVPGLGPRLTNFLLQHFGSPAAIRRAAAAQLQAVPRIGPKLADSFAAALQSLDLDAELALLAKHRVELVALGTPEYPPQLAEIADAPHLLFTRGTLTVADRNAVGIVGSRQCTAYGKRLTERLASGLVRAGVTVVSGLARGIDGVAHRAALDAGGRTIAVLAGGLSRIYPPEHKELADAVEQAGCLVTETPLSVPPQPGMFPARNRIISGLSRAVVIVEAGEKSGALITADHAAEQGREVMAVPGNADSEASAGTLRLLRNGARLVRSADDILEDLQGIAPPTPIVKRDAPTLFTEPPPPAGPPPGLDTVQLQVWEYLADGPKHADEISRALNVPAAQLGGLLMMLEMKKVIRRQVGNVYGRK